MPTKKKQLVLFDMPTKDGEEWAVYDPAPTYHVSSHGRVYRERVEAKSSHAHATQTRGGKLYTTTNVQTAGYPQLSIKIDGEWRKKLLHRLVMHCHGPEPPTEDHVINHIDGDPSNPKIGNLEWVTQAENTLHSRLMAAIDTFGKAVVRQKVERWLESM